jgi:hypothetical protein
MKLFKTELLVLIVILLSFNGFLNSEEVAEKNLTPLDGELLLPEGYNNTAEEKKCITVCSQWGEDCILSINPSATGGASRKCRRVCKSFAETCF